MATFQSFIGMLRLFVVHLFKVRSKLGRGKVSVFHGLYTRRRHDGGAALDEFVDIYLGKMRTSMPHGWIQRIELPRKRCRTDFSE